MAPGAIIPAGPRRDLSGKDHASDIKPVTENLRYWTSWLLAPSKHPFVTLFLVHRVDTLLPKTTIKQFWGRRMDLPFVHDFFLKKVNRALLFLGLKLQDEFCFQHSLMLWPLPDIIRDGPCVKETHCVAGLAVPSCFLALRSWKGNWETGGTCIRGRGVASMIAKLGALSSVCWNGINGCGQWRLRLVQGQGNLSECALEYE